MGGDQGSPGPAQDGAGAAPPVPPGARSLTADAVSAFQHAPIAVAVCDGEGVVTRVNPAMTRLLGHPGRDLVGRTLFWLVEEERVGAAVAACRALREGPAESAVHETRLRTAQGRLIDVRVTTSAVRAATTDHPHAILHLEDVTEREDLRRRLEHQAHHDPLTGLGNRVRFLQELERALPRARRHGRPVTVLYLDLDGFKAVNDTHGHATGDEVLVAFARHVRECVRPEDATARLGGDEFGVLCEDTTREEAALVVQRLSAGSWAAAAGGVAVGVTVGAATRDGSTRNLAEGLRPGGEALLHDADVAMYEAKARRRPPAAEGTSPPG